MAYPRITFGEIRNFCSVLNRISVCVAETLCYENFESIREVPHTYDGWYLHGFGVTDSEFQEKGRLSLRLCMEFLLSETPWKEAHI